MAKWSEDKVASAMNPDAKLQSINAKQKNEIARLTQALEKCTAEKAKLLADIKWMRGER